MFYHRGPFYQTGRGVGSFFKSIFRVVAPALQSLGSAALKNPKTKRILKAAKESAIDAGIDIARDTLGGKDITQSITDNVTKAVGSVVKKVEKRPPKRKKPRGKKNGGSKKSKYGSSIFDPKF
jgi:hypothetical protein